MLAWLSPVFEPLPDAPMIRIRGARTHNLKNIDLDLPRHRLIVITGLSGSGKSSLAFDTLFAEGQRRYVESLSAYARQFLGLMEKPDVDRIDGLSPAIAIEQKSTSHNPRSTVGTVTEIHDYLRLLFARVGTPQCPTHGTALNAQTVSQMVDQILAFPERSRWMILAPVVTDRKGEHAETLAQFQQQGFLRVRVNGTVYELDALPARDPHHKHTIELVVDRLKIREGIQQRLAESIETALGISDGTCRVVPMDPDPGPEYLFSARFACPHCGYSLRELEPRLFSFNSPSGACPDCDGLGVRHVITPEQVIADPERGLNNGAIHGWDPHNPDAERLIRALAHHYGFDPETPFEALAEPIRNALLFGSGDEAITMELPAGSGSRERRRVEEPFEGIIPNLERRYQEAEGRAAREELGRYFVEKPCPTCAGSRLNEAARHVFVGGRSLPEVNRLSIEQARGFLEDLGLAGNRASIADPIQREIGERLRFLLEVGLAYLTLDRSAESLSGGEAQRIRLASQIGAGLTGVTYTLDEPSIGLHPRDNQRLLASLMQLRDLQNTVIVVEHDEEAIRAADHVVDIGPGAGIHGGRIVAEGPPAVIARSAASLTGQYLCGERRITAPEARLDDEPPDWIRLLGASGHNLKGVDAAFPVGRLTCVTGVSGSGKSTLINETLYRALARAVNRAAEQPAPYRHLEGLEAIDKVIAIDQSPIGRTPRSNPATYTGMLTPIRELFAATPEARARGYTPGRFSFNIKGGRCEACQGDGVVRVEMHFLPDIEVPCDVCAGRRYNRETLEIRYKGKTIHEVLAMTVEEAINFFAPIPAIARKLDTLWEVGLGYVTLGQSAPTLSGGEAQRVKLARELAKRETGKTLYILDEPTTGLHFYDIEQLLRVVHRLRDRGNTVIVIEHNLDVIKTADWIIDLGPEGGEAGGTILAAGPPASIAACQASHTGRYLQPLIAPASRADSQTTSDPTRS